MYLNSLIVLIVAFSSIFVNAQQFDDKSRSLLISLNPKRGKFTLPQDLVSNTGVPFGILQGLSDFLKIEHPDLIDPIDSDFWKSPKSGNRKEILKLSSKVVVSECVDCIETYPGMYQVKANADGKNIRITFHREVKVNLFRFALMFELGYRLPAQNFSPFLRINFKDAAEKEVFKTNLLGQMGYDVDFKWSRWIEEEGEDWVLAKSVIVEEDWKKEIKGFHWLNITEEQVEKHRALRGLFVIALLTDWGEKLSVGATQFIRRKRGYLFIKHPLNTLFSKVHISDLKWMVRKILDLDNPTWGRAIKAMNLSSDRHTIVSSKVMALLNYFKQIFFSKAEIAGLPERPTNYIIDKSATIPALKKNWRYYVMLGVDRLVGSAGVRRLARLARVDWNRTIKKFDGDKEEAIEGMIDGQSTGKKGKVQLSLGLHARAGLIMRYSRDLVRGQYYGNTHLANLADTMTYGAFGQFGVYADFLEKIPLTLYQGAAWERSIIHLQPVQSLDEAYQKFFHDALLPLKLRRWKKTFRKTGCSYKKNERKKSQPGFKNCDEAYNALTDFTKKLQIDETLILNTSLSFSKGARVGIPSMDILYGINPLKRSDVHIGRGKVNLKRMSIVRTETGIRVIITKNKNVFRKLDINLRFFIKLFEINNRKDISAPDTQVYDLNFETLSDQRKLHAFFALRGILVARDPSFLERFFNKEKIKNKIVAKKKSRQWSPLPLIKDRVNLSNRVTIEVFEDGKKRELVLYKTIERKYWNWLGFAENLINSLLPKGRVKLRSARDGENAGDLKRNAGIYVVVSEAELTDKDKGVFNPIVILKGKYVRWKAKKKRVLKAVERIKLKYKGLYLDDIFDDLKLGDLEKIKQFELREILVLKGKLIKKWLSCFTQSSSVVFNEKNCLIPESIIAKVTRMKRKFDFEDMENRLKFIHEFANVLMKKFSIDELLKFYKHEDIYTDVQISGWAFKKGQEKPYFISQGVNKNQEQFHSVFAHMIRELDLPAYEVNGNFIAPGF